MEKEITVEEFCEHFCNEIKEGKISHHGKRFYFDWYGNIISEYIHIYKGSDNANLLIDTMYQLFTH